MAIAIESKVSDIAVHLTTMLYEVSASYVDFIEDLELHHFHPESVDCTIVKIVEKYAQKIEELNAQLKQYAFFREDLTEIIESMDTLIEQLADRFLAWTERKTISVTEAIQVFGKSRSTIYRWIHSGKLVAQKQHGRWIVAI